MTPPGSRGGHVRAGIELLAPAKDLACGIAAVGAGADAVYIGAEKFSARSAAGNPVGDIARLVDHAHKYWVRVYAAVNTILRDDELRAAEKLIRRLHASGVDALIIQDMAILELDAPRMPLIASTQTAAATAEKIRFLEQCGFFRVILPRELSLDEIRAIRKKTAIELEVFVHGALCFSVSGQCCLSHALGGRSGNRGECAQPCRQRYALVGDPCCAPVGARGRAPGKHYLSLKDLNLSAHLKELMAAGAASFKIEGRLKDEVYVKNITAYYRRKLDELEVARPSSGRTEVPFEPDPEKTFNRGFTTYFLSGRQGDVFSWDTPKSKGEPLGIVRRIGEGFADIETSATIHSGDGISFFTADGELRGMYVRRAEGSRIHVDKTLGLRRGMEVFRNRDREFERQVKKWAPERRISVDLVFEESEKGFRLLAADEDGVTAAAEIEHEKAPAKNPMRETIEVQLSRLGGTGFAARSVSVRWLRDWFMPVKTLNEMRRAVVAALAGARRAARPALAAKEPDPRARYPERRLSHLGNVLNEKARRFYLKHGVETIEPAAEAGTSMRGRKVMTARACLARALGRCDGSSKQPQKLLLRDDRGRVLELKLDCRDCWMEVFLEDRSGAPPRRPRR